MNKTILSDNKKGYILEVDLEYPEELHELHNDYPLGTGQKVWGGGVGGAEHLEMWLIKNT